MTQSARSLLVRRFAALAGATEVALTITMAPDSAAAAAPAPPPLDAVRASPYLYLQNARSVDPARLIKATGLRWVTVGFIAPAGGTRCEPAWADGAGGLGSRGKGTIDAIRAAGGDAMVSLGGGGTTKLGVMCGSAAALAGAYQKVVSAYHLRAVDLDFEGAETQSAAVRTRNAQALKILQSNNPGLQVHITMAAGPGGFNGYGRSMVDAVHTAGVNVSSWSGMNMYFGGSTHMGQDSVTAMNSIAAKLRATYGYTAADALHRVGSVNLIGVNAGGDDETTSLADMRVIAAFAEAHRIGRFSFWNVGRDIACGGTPSKDQCSGVSQNEFDFTRIVVSSRTGTPAPVTPPATPTWPTLRQGATGASVTALQDLLRSHGAAITADGVYGSRTTAAVKAFQSRAGLNPDGLVGPRTWPKLLVTVRGGSSGDATKAAQVALNHAGSHLSVDGKFGAQSTAATLAFQKSHHLTADGVVGPSTWAALI